MYYHNSSTEKFIDLLPAHDDQEVTLMQQAASQTHGATVEVLFRGTDESVVNDAGEAYATYAHQVNAWREQAAKSRIDVTSDPEQHRAMAQRLLRNGGALVRLTMRPANTSPLLPEPR